MLQHTFWYPNVHDNPAQKRAELWNIHVGVNIDRSYKRYWNNTIPEKILQEELTIHHAASLWEAMVLLRQKMLPWKCGGIRTVCILSLTAMSRPTAQPTRNQINARVKQLETDNPRLYKSHDNTTLNSSHVVLDKTRKAY